MSGVRKVLIAIDFSQSSKQALQYASQFFHGCGVEFHVAHIVADPFIEGSYIPHLSVDKMEKTTEEYAQEALSKFIPGKFMDTESVTTVVLRGDPYAEIVNYAAEHKVEMIVIGSHGSSPIENMLIGSVADKVIRMSSVPVLVVKS
ncbi:MAG: universal stress protein [bacterium]|nr:universal stress protein [bacterium]